MGCLKLPYRKEGLGKYSPLKICKGLEKKESVLKNCDDYYPFGLTFNSSERSGFTSNKFLFQSQELQDDLDLGWYSFKWRNHQPDIGRFFNVDPLAEEYHWWSPYAFSGNMVTAHRELEGLEPVTAIIANQSPQTYRGMVDAAGRTKPQVEIKVGLGNTVGIQGEFGPINAGAYYDAGTYNIGYNSQDGWIDEKTEGSGFAVGPIYGEEQEKIVAFEEDGRSEKVNAGMVEIDKETTIMGVMKLEDITESAYTVNQGDTWSGSRMGNSALAGHKYDRDNRTKGQQQGESKQSTNSSFEVSFDFRAILRLYFAFKLDVPMSENNTTNSNEP
jgi:RHS repeat-associated protein